MKQTQLKSYPLPLRGQLLLACAKCLRKLKHGDDPEHLRSLKKLLKLQSKQDPTGLRIHILKVPCLDVCPRGGVTVCTAAQAARHQFSVLRAQDDVAALYQQCKDKSGEPVEGSPPFASFD